jgi:hypothetical protein
MAARRTRRLLVALPLVALPLLAGCSGSVSIGTGGATSSAPGTIDEQKVASAISANITKSVGENVPVNVTCPADVELKAATSFACTGTVDGQALTVDVTQKDALGNVSFESQESLIEMKKAQDAIAADATKRSGAAYRATCPGPRGAKWFLGKPGATFTCTVTSGGDTMNVVVTVKDNNGAISWKYQTK